jgi:hypothetical protein
METNTFIVIGRIPGQCVLIHKEDLQDFKTSPNKLELDCVVIDLITGVISEPITIQQLVDVCPFDEVTDIGEISVLGDLIVDVLPAWKVEEIDNVFTRIKKPFNRLEVRIEHQLPKSS